jgi:glutathione peroxidase
MIKKSLFLFIVVLSFYLNSNSQSLYDLRIKTIAGDSVALSTYAGKKIMFIIAPLSGSDSLYTQLKEFKSRYKDSVHVVGILSVEDGYKNADADKLKKLYQNAGITLTEGMSTKKSSGVSQSLLLQWLTDKNKNRHFNNDAAGPGTKFFVNEKGRLYAVIPPQASLKHTIVEKIMQSNTAAQ